MINILLNTLCRSYLHHNLTPLGMNIDLKLHLICYLHCNLYQIACKLFMAKACHE